MIHSLSHRHWCCAHCVKNWVFSVYGPADELAHDYWAEVERHILNRNIPDKQGLLTYWTLMETTQKCRFMPLALSVRTFTSIFCETEGNSRVFTWTCQSPHKETHKQQLKMTPQMCGARTDEFSGFLGWVMNVYYENPAYTENHKMLKVWFLTPQRWQCVMEEDWDGPHYIYS